MATNNCLPRLNLLTWLEHITEIIVQLSWWRQSEWVKIKFIVSTFEPRDPVRPISRSVVQVHNCALILFLFLWQSVSQENTAKVCFSNKYLSQHLRFQSCSKVCLEEQFFLLGCSFILNKTFRFIWQHLINFQIHFFKLFVCFISLSRLRKNILKLWCGNFTVPQRLWNHVTNWVELHLNQSFLLLMSLNFVEKEFFNYFQKNWSNLQKTRSIHSKPSQK